MQVIYMMIHLSVAVFRLFHLFRLRILSSTTIASILTEVTLERDPCEDNTD